MRLSLRLFSPHNLIFCVVSSASVKWCSDWHCDLITVWTCFPSLCGVCMFSPAVPAGRWRSVLSVLQMLKAPLLLAVASALLHPSRAGRVVSERQRSPPRAKKMTVNLYLDPSVHAPMPRQSFPTAANMSLTPWIYRESSVDSRIPRKISQAKCLTSNCLDPRGGGETTDLLAQPIKYPILVLHVVRGKNCSSKRFRLKMKEITVGCTCVRPTVLPQQ